MKSTVVYKTVDHCEIRGDFYHSSKQNSPVVIYIHGGALISGSRKDINPEHVDLYNKAGFSVFSIDYRLAPETKLNAIIDDIRDVFMWLKHEGRNSFDIEDNNIAVIGSSAGAYLSLMTGTFRKKPKAIVSFYGYGDILGDWYGKPSEFYCQKPLVSKDEAYSCVSSSVISESDIDRFSYYLYCRQQGVWTKEVSGLELLTHKLFLMEYCPLYNVSTDFPPTLLLHGTHDTDVPFEQSYLMSQKLINNGVTSKLVAIEGLGHGFDSDMRNPVVIHAIEEVIEFLKTHLQ